MIGLWNLIRRNCKLFFKDKGVFFTSLITPAILLLLYITFLGNVYRDSFAQSIPETFDVPTRLIDGLVGGELISSLLAVSCVTVAFCSNMIMVGDKASGILPDLRVSPVKRSTLALGYFLSTVLVTTLVLTVGLGLCLLYVWKVGWYLSLSDVLLLLGDILLTTLFGSALASIVDVFLTSQGQISAVGTIVSSGYGFICGAYMPISNFSDGLQKAISFLPGTYATALFRNHAMRGALDALTDQGLPTEFLDGLRKSVDCDLSFLGHAVPIPAMYAVMGITVTLLIAAYVAIHALKNRKA